MERKIKIRTKTEEPKNLPKFDVVDKKVDDIFDKNNVE